MGRSCLGGSRSGRPLRDRAAEGALGQKVHDRTHVFGSPQREALTPVAPLSFCNRRKPCPVFAGERGWGRVLMNGKSKKRGGDADIPDHARRRMLLVPLLHSLFQMRAGEGGSSTYKKNQTKTVQEGVQQ